MNNYVKLYFSNNFSDEEASDYDMQVALTLIAKKIERFKEFVARKNNNYKNNNTLEKLYKIYKTKFHMKNRQLKKLKENLNTICNVAKIIMIAKNKEKKLLMSYLTDMRNESSHIKKNNEQYLSLIHQLRMENYNINNDVKLFYHFIHLAYEKLQIMRNETPNCIPHIDELKAILLACGQYCADYCNTQDRCDQLERKNRFLQNKLNIVENNLAATTTELQNLRSQNRKLRMKCEANYKNVDDPVKNLTHENVTEMYLNKVKSSGVRNYCYNAVISKTVQLKRKNDPYNRSLNIESHLETVKNLLSDQENMLKELKKLSSEVFNSRIPI